MSFRARLVLTTVLAAGPLAPARAQSGSPFHPVVTVEEDDALDLALVGDMPIVRYAHDGLALARLGPGGMVRDERLATGIAHCGDPSTASFSGRFPQPWWLVKDLHAWSACPEDSAHILRWAGDAWSMVADLDAHNVKAAPWKQGSALVLEVPYRDGPPWGYELHVVGGPKGLVPPEPTRARRNRGQDSHCYTELEGAGSLVTAKDGSALVVSGSRCVHDDEGPDDYPAVEYFGPGVRRGRILLAPIRVLPEQVVFFVRSPGDFWLGGARTDKWAQLAHFDGRGWTRTSGPPGRLMSFAVDGQGTIWALSYVDERYTVWRRRGGGRWRRVPLPPGTKTVVDLVVRRGGDAWLVAEHGIYSTLPVREVLAWKGHECTEAEQERVGREFEVVHAMSSKGEGSSPCCGEPPLGPAPTGPPVDPLY
jgi:hypothetical protein